MKTARYVAIGVVIGAIAGLIISTARASVPYTATAVVRFLPASIPEHFVRTHDAVDTGRLVNRMSQPVFSRASLTRYIEEHKLYLAELARLPLEDVLQTMRKAIRIGPAEGNTLGVSFTYSDRERAQRVANAIATSLIGEYSRIRTDRSALTLQFMQDKAELAGVELQERLARLRSAAAGSVERERLALDVEIARRRYEDLSAKRAEAEMLDALERRQQGATLEFLDFASVAPEWRPSPVWFSLATAVLGGMVALLLQLAQRAWRMRTAPPATEAPACG
jgi:hypothetical protein